MALEIRALCLFAWLSETVFESEDLFVFTLLSASVRTLHTDGVVGLQRRDLELPFCVNISRQGELLFPLKCQKSLSWGQNSMCFHYISYGRVSC